MDLPKLNKEIALNVDEEYKNEEERISKELGIDGYKEIDKIVDSFNGRKKISISYLQRTFSYGFNKAHKIFDFLVDKYIETDGTVIKEMLALHNENYVKPMKIIFLDVDGVLNCRSTKDICGPFIGIDDKKVGYLKHIVDFTNAKIVLVSTWKEYWFKTQKEDQDYMATYLDNKLKKHGLKIFDKTDDNNSFDRGAYIQRYLKIKELNGVNISNFVILDDEMFDYKECKLTKYLVRTSFNSNGLTIKHVKKAIEMLNK